MTPSAHPPYWTAEWRAEGHFWDTRTTSSTRQAHRVLGIQVDIGGSSGVTTIQLLRHAMNIVKLTVQDLPNVIAEAQSKPKPDDIAPRLEFQLGNFSQPQQIKDADVHYPRHVLHDWPLDKALETLRDLVPSIKVGGMLLVSDADIARSSDDPYAAIFARAEDLQMMVAANARERTLEWEAVIAEAVGEESKLESIEWNSMVLRKV
ncbi:hypothetical protein Q7P37_008355 [Cladosporium fusiforme]